MPPGSGILKASPWWFSRSPPAMARTICTVSLVALSGAENRTPCQPSMTCGPLTPRPSRNLPPDNACSDIADIASMAGVLAPSCAMPEPRRILVVRAAR